MKAKVEEGLPSSLAESNDIEFLPSSVRSEVGGTATCLQPNVRCQRDQQRLGLNKNPHVTS
eukprot:4719806-Amphidinium_carterae.1